MQLSGKIRFEFAMLLIGIATLALVVGGWLFFGSFSQVLIDAASGAVTSTGHLGDLLAIQRSVLIFMMVLAAVLLSAFVVMYVTREIQMTQVRDLQVLAARAEAVGGAQNAEDIKSRFLEIIAHQLRTPLTAVRWNLEALVKGDLGALKKRQQDILEITAKNHQGILVMLADWVEALEVERGLLQLNLEPTDLHAILESLTHDFQGQAKLKHQKFVVRTERNLPKAHADHLKLRYIMTKLLSNAMGYTPDLGVVTLRVSADDTMVRFEVTDTGVGIPYEDQPNVFKKFFRASNAALMQPNASGVGLFVTKTLIEAMGGIIDFTSEEGKGTTFWFTVPKLLVAPPTLGKPTKKRR